MSKRTLLLASCLVALSVSATLVAQEKKYGAGVKLAQATTIKALYESPEKFVGKTIRIDGVVSAVCEEMGCWIALAAKDAPEQSVRFKVKDGEVVFPTSAMGKMASAQGVFEKVADGDDHAADAAREEAARLGKSTDFTKRYQVKATGAVIK